MEDKKRLKDELELAILRTREQISNSRSVFYNDEFLRATIIRYKQKLMELQSRRDNGSR